MVLRSQQFPPVSYWWPLLPNSIFFSVCPMAAYLVGIQTIVDSDALNRYIKAALPSMSEFGAKPLAVDLHAEVLEGTQKPPGSRVVIVEFESKEKLLAWYTSDGYQIAMRERVGALDGFALIADGLPT